MNQSRSGRGGKRAGKWVFVGTWQAQECPGNNPELAQVVIAGSSQCSYVLSKRQFLVQDDLKVPDGSGEKKGWEFSRKGLIVQLVQLLADMLMTVYTPVIANVDCMNVELVPADSIRDSNIYPNLI